MNTRPIWQPDESCDQCNECHSGFSLFNRRHHCRNCGKIFCDTCSSERLTLFHLGYPGLERVCKRCAVLLKEKGKTTLHQQMYPNEPNSPSSVNTVPNNQMITVKQQYALNEEQNNQYPTTPTKNNNQYPENNVHQPVMHSPQPMVNSPQPTTPNNQYPQHVMVQSPPPNNPPSPYRNSVHQNQPVILSPNPPVHNINPYFNPPILPNQPISPISPMHPQQQQYPNYPIQQQYPPIQPMPHQQPFPLQLFPSYGSSQNCGNALINSLFFKNVSTEKDREYILLLDASGSMDSRDGHHFTRWEQGEDSLLSLIPFIKNSNVHGFSLYLFNHKAEKFTHVHNSHEVKKIFKHHKPHGSTDLAQALILAFQEHFHKKKPTSFLIITDGEPNCDVEAYEVLQRNIDKLHCDHDLSITFIQIGHCQKAAFFLEKLQQDQMRFKFPVIDCISSRHLKHMHFHEFIGESVHHYIC